MENFEFVQKSIKLQVSTENVIGNDSNVQHEILGHENAFSLFRLTSVIGSRRMMRIECKSSSSSLKEDC